MIKVENIQVFNFDGAIRAMRNPLNSWAKSDSGYLCVENDGLYCEAEIPSETTCNPNKYHIGPNDLDLMRRLFRSGVEHRTYARMVQVSMDITAPLYWWKEADRYTIGKSQVSTSTMHKIHSKEFELDDFSYEHLIVDDDDCDWENGEYPGRLYLETVIDGLNTYRNKYLNTKDKKYWWQLIQLLPSSYNQKRTICMNYEVVFKMIRERSNHKLDEWRSFVDILKTLPYVKEIMEDE